MIMTKDDTPIKIGRGHECEIRITDISVSRKHAEINLK
jgi:pSer/pThr/pTyr-binding forkhead associated (FHA) protein